MVPRYILLMLLGALALQLTACEDDKITQPPSRMESGTEAVDPQTVVSVTMGKQATEVGHILNPRHRLTVYKSPTCGCCGAWVEHMEAQGFANSVKHPEDLNGLKQSLGIGPQYQSCHTAVTESGYVFEGHIPAHLIVRFLNETPDGAIGLAVPGMPVGSPGMEIEQRFQPYQVYLLREDGSSEVYASVNDQASQYLRVQ